MSELSFNDLFDFNESSQLDEIIAKLQELKKINDVLKDVAQDRIKTQSEEYKSLIKQVKLLNNELKNSDIGSPEGRKKIDATSKEIQELSSQYDKLSKAQKELDSTNKQLESSQKKLANAQAKLKQATDGGANSLEDLRKKAKAAEKEFSLLGDEASEADKKMKFEELRKSLQDFEQSKQAVKDLKKEVRLVKTPYAELSKQLRDLKQELKGQLTGIDQFGNAIFKNADKAEKLKKEIAQLDDGLKKFDKSLGESFRNVGNYQSALDGVSFEGILGGLQDARGGGIGGSLAGLAGSIPVPQLAAAAAAIGAVGAGLDELVDITQEVNKQLRDTSNLVGFAGQELFDFTAGLRASAKTFEVDFNEILVSSNALVKEFGLNGDQALEIINEGFINGANVSGEFLDQIREYSGLIQEAGIDANTFVDIITTSVKEGIYSDKAIDSIKEASIALRENTKTTQDALRPLGELRNQQIKSAIAAGDNFKAIQLVSKGLNEVELTASQTGAILADVFKGAGEDATLDFIKGLENIGNAANDANEGLTKYQQAQLELLQSNQQLAEAETRLATTIGSSTNGFEKFGNTLKTGVLNFVVAFLNSLVPLKDAFSDLFSSVKELVGRLFSFNKESDESIDLMKVLTNVFRILHAPLEILVKTWTFFVDLITDTVSEVPFLNKVFDELGKVFGAVLTSIENAPAIFTGFLYATKAAFTGILDLAKEVFSQVDDLIIAALDPTSDFDEVLGSIKGSFKNYGDEIARAYSEGYNSVIKEEREKQLALEQEERDKFAKEQAEKDKIAAEKALKERERLYEKSLKARLELEKFRLEREIEIQNRIAENEEKTNLQRINAARKAFLAKKKLLELELNAAIEASETAAEKELAGAIFTAGLEDARAEFEKFADELIESSQKKGKTLGEQFAESILRGFEQTSGKLQQFYEDDVTALNESLQKGLISVEQYNQKRQNIEDDFAKRRLQAEITLLEQQVDAFEGTEEEKLELKRQLSEARIELSDIETAEELDNEEKKKEAYQEIYARLTDVINGFFQNRISKITMEQEALQAQKEYELQLVAGNEEAQAEIERKFAEQEEELRQKKIREERKAAIFQKAVGITNAIVSTGEAVTKTLAIGGPLGIALAAIVGALGAAQVATIASAPLPQYFKGREDGPAETAWINEQGIELVENKRTGKKRIYNNDGPTVVDLQAGDKVYTAQETAKLFDGWKTDELANSAVRSMNEDSRQMQITIKDENKKDDRLLKEYIKSNQRLEQSIKENGNISVNIDENGFKKWVNRGQNWTDITNTRYK